jgi:hypothetical protein
MIAIFIGVLMTGGIMAGVWLARGQVWKKLPVVLNWMGVLIALGSFFFLPWITFGPPDVIEKNTAWLAKQSLVLDTLKKLPGSNKLFESPIPWTAQEIWNALHHPLKDRIFQISVTGEYINGWALSNLLIQTDWVDIFFLILSVIVIFLAIVQSLLGLFSQKKIPQPFLIGMAFYSGLVFIGLLMGIPRLDLLGKENDIILRLIMVLAEVHVAGGAGWYVTGLLMIFCSSVISSIWPVSNVFEYNLEEYGQ